MKLRWVLVALLAATPHLTAQEKKPELRWGTDPTGGGPYVYQEGTQEYIGFEVELASYLAQKIGRTPVMKKGDWKALPELLDKSTDADEAIDIVLNGYELREDLTKRYSATLPYYAYRLVLIAREDNNEINNWSDLAVAKPRMKSVGVLTGTVAQEELKAVYGPLVNAAVSDDVENVVGLVKDKRLDATLQDSPAGVYFLKKYGGLKIAGPPRQLNYYVIYLRKDDKELTDALNAAIRAGFEDGTLQKIYQKYGLWNEDQKWLNFTQTGKWPETIEPPSDPSGTRNEKDAKVEKTSPWSWMLMDLLQAAGMTVLLAITSFPIAMLMGLLIALVRVYAHWIIAIPFGIYVEVIRGTPLLLQLYTIFYLIPKLGLGIDFTPFEAGIIGLAINYSAYESENYRAGLLAIPKGQMEAALALGMSPLTALRVIIVPQAVRIVIPPVTNDFIALFKDTSVCSVILITELTRKYNELYNFNRDYIVELAFVTASLYLIMSYPMAILARVVERKLAFASRGNR